MNRFPTRTFLIPPILITGSGSSENVEEETKKLGVKKGPIVTDEFFFQIGNVGWCQKTLMLLRGD